MLSDKTTKGEVGNPCCNMKITARQINRSIDLMAVRASWPKHRWSCSYGIAVSPPSDKWYDQDNLSLSRKDSEQIVSMIYIQVVNSIWVAL